MVLSILLAVSAITVALAEFMFRDKNEHNGSRLSWTKIIASLVVFFIGTYIAIEPSLMEYKADNYYKNGEYSKAISNYKKLELTDPENINLLSKIGRIYKTFAGQANESVIRDEFLGKSIEYYARLSVYNQQAIEPKLAMMSIFSIGGMEYKYTEYFGLLKAQLEVEGYLKNYDGSSLSNQQLSEVHRRLADYLAQAYEYRKLRLVALKSLGYPISTPEILLDIALEHLEISKQLYPSSQGVLIVDSQLSLRRSRVGDIHSSENISYLQRAFDSSFNLFNTKTKIKHRVTMQTRVVLKTLLDPRISKIDTKKMDISSVADKLEGQTNNLRKHDEGYMVELSNNASYLYQAYKEIGNIEKYKKWEMEVVNLRSYLKPVRKKFLCRKYNVICG